MSTLRHRLHSVGSATYQVMFGGAATPAEITSPASGTTFYVGVAKSVSLAGPDATYETSWTSAFTATNGDIVVSGGTGSGDVTAAWADGIASPERATLYVRNKAIGGAAIASQSAPIFTPWMAAIQGQTVTVAHDLALDTKTTNGTITSDTPYVGGTAADVMIPGVAPVWTASDAKLGGRPSLSSTGTEWLTPTTPASSVSTTQPATWVLFGVPPSNAASSAVWLSGAVSSPRWLIKRSTNTYSAGGSAVVDTGIAVDSSQGALILLEMTGTTSSIFRVRKSDGTLASATENMGTAASQGFAFLSNYAGSLNGEGAIGGCGVISEVISAANIQRLEQWMQLSAARGGMGASGWTP
jgi:hypothetical protein